MECLKLSPDLPLPLASVMWRIAVFGMTGSGKTNTLGVLAEELLRHPDGLPVIIDPTDASWGLQFSADGKSPSGLRIVVFGGPNGQFPLTIQSAELLADLAVKERLPMVLSLKLLEDEERLEFVNRFLRRIYATNRDPLQLMLDEAHNWAPEIVSGGKTQFQSRAIVQRIATEGRGAGLGLICLSQRSAALSKAVRAECTAFITHALSDPDAIDAVTDWMKNKVTPEEHREAKAEIGHLPVGTAYVTSIGKALSPNFRRVAVRLRDTFDSSPTPILGQRTQRPTAMAQLDLAGIKAQIDATLRVAAAEDPAFLRVRVGELERENEELRKRPAEVPAPIQVPVLTPDDRAAFELLRVTLGEARKLIEGAADAVGTRLEAIEERLGSEPVSSPADSTNNRPVTPAPIERPEPRPPRSAPLATGELSDYDLNLLQTMDAHRPRELTRHQLALFAAVSDGSGTFNRSLAALRREGLLSPSGLQLTKAGIARANGKGKRLSHAKVRELARARLDDYTGVLFDVAVAAYPEALDREQLAARAGSSSTSGTFNRALALLRKTGLLEGFRAHPDLFEEKASRKAVGT